MLTTKPRTSDGKLYDNILNPYMGGSRSLYRMSVCPMSRGTFVIWDDVPWLAFVIWDVLLHTMSRGKRFVIRDVCLLPMSHGKFIISNPYKCDSVSTRYSYSMSRCVFNYVRMFGAKTYAGEAWGHRKAHGKGYKDHLQ